LVVGVGDLEILDCFSIQKSFQTQGESLFRGLKY